MKHALYIIARPDSQFLCCTCVYFLGDILWPEVLMTVMCIQLVHILHVHSSHSPVAMNFWFYMSQHACIPLTSFAQGMNISGYEYYWLITCPCAHEAQVAVLNYIYITR